MLSSIVGGSLGQRQARRSKFTRYRVVRLIGVSLDVRGLLE